MSKISVCYTILVETGYLQTSSDGVKPDTARAYLYTSIDHAFWLEEQMANIRLNSEIGNDQTHGSEVTCMFLTNTTGLHCLLLREDEADNQSKTLCQRRVGVMNVEYNPREVHVWLANACPQLTIV